MVGGDTITPPAPSQLYCPSRGPDLPGQQPLSALKAWVICVRTAGLAASCHPTPVLAKPELCGVKSGLPSSQLPSPARRAMASCLLWALPACGWGYQVGSSGITPPLGTEPSVVTWPDSRQCFWGTGTPGHMW